ncbi:hypothetical protein HG444_000790 [Candidatus Saccharibacteria bacterium]|nr:hypothetical protein [Candidatus Saccharibacteria bacterium]
MKPAKKEVKMTDIDFDELDRAVQSLMNSKKRSPARPKSSARSLAPAPARGARRDTTPTSPVERAATHSLSTSPISAATEPTQQQHDTAAAPTAPVVFMPPAEEPEIQGHSSDHDAPASSEQTPHIDAAKVVTAAGNQAAAPSNAAKADVDANSFAWPAKGSETASGAITFDPPAAAESTPEVTPNGATQRVTTSEATRAQHEVSQEVTPAPAPPQEPAATSDDKVSTTSSVGSVSALTPPEPVSIAAPVPETMQRKPASAAISQPAKPTTVTPLSARRVPLASATVAPAVLESERLSHQSELAEASMQRASVEAPSDEPATSAGLQAKTAVLNPPQEAQPSWSEPAQLGWTNKELDSVEMQANLQPEPTPEPTKPAVSAAKQATGRVSSALKRSVKAAAPAAVQSLKAARAKSMKAVKRPSQGRHMDIVSGTAPADEPVLQQISPEAKALQANQHTSRVVQDIRRPKQKKHRGSVSNEQDIMAAATAAFSGTPLHGTDRIHPAKSTDGNQEAVQPTAKASALVPAPVKKATEAVQQKAAAVASAAKQARKEAIAAQTAPAAPKDKGEAILERAMKQLTSDNGSPFLPDAKDKVEKRPLGSRNSGMQPVALPASSSYQRGRRHKERVIMPLDRPHDDGKLAEQLSNEIAAAGGDAYGAPLYNQSAGSSAPAKPRRFNPVVPVTIIALVIIAIIGGIIIVQMIGKV